MFKERVSMTYLRRCHWDVANVSNLELDEVISRCEMTSQSKYKV